MLRTIRKSAVTVAALGALGLGGAAIAGAADDPASSGASSAGKNSAQTRPGRAAPEALPSEVAAKVKAAALEELPGATVLRTEAGGPYGTPYHVHIRTSAGARRVVLVNSSFEATDVQADRAGGGGGRGGPGGPGGPGHHRGGRDETALTGETKQKVEAAVLARYQGATILRTETNGDSAAPYESHIRTSAGKELEVLVTEAFEVVDAREHPARP
jgi:hypothetical protein